MSIHVVKFLYRLIFYEKYRITVKRPASSVYVRSFVRTEGESKENNSPT